MELLEILFIFIIALVVGGIFYYGLGRRGPYGAFWVFLLILFLAGLAGRFWITPAGPIIWGYAWFPLIFWVLLIALFIGAATPTGSERLAARDQERIISQSDAQRSQKDRKIEEERAASAGAVAVFGIFFWLLLFLLIIAIITGFFL